MSTTLTAPSASLVAAAQNAGLTLTATEPGTDFAGTPTTRAIVALVSDQHKQLILELSEAFDASNPRFAADIAVFFAEAAQRLRNPRPDCYLTLHGIPLSFGNFAWPFHTSTSGADTHIVHGEIRLEDATNSPEPGKQAILHAKISAAMTQTFATVVAALEQPFAEGFIYNAVRKTLDQGQLELVKSGNRQPVPVTTRYYSMKQQVFIFNDTNPAQRKAFLAAKTFWLSHILGGDAPVWLTDPRDAQYLNTTVADLKSTAAELAKEGLILIGEASSWATASPELQSRHSQFVVELHEALAFIKPTFNEDMRAGNTNM